MESNWVSGGLRPAVGFWLRDIGLWGWVGSWSQAILLRIKARSESGRPLTNGFRRASVTFGVEETLCCPAGLGVGPFVRQTVSGRHASPQAAIRGPIGGR